MRKITYTIIPLWITFCLLKDHLIRLYEGSNYPSTTPEQYRLMFTRYIEKIDKKIENYRYSHNFMEKMVHSLVKDIPVHPTIIWRFWNILKQEPEFKNETMDKSITTTEYVKLDLSRFEKLEDIRAILNTPYSSNDILNINDKNDPRFYIINTLLDDNSNISYTFFSSSSPIDSIGVIQEDNTVVLRANDVFRVAALSLVKDIDSLSPLCTRLFSKSSKITNEIMKITIRHYIKTGVSIFIFIKLLQYMF